MHSLRRLAHTPSRVAHVLFVRLKRSNLPLFIAFFSALIMFLRALSGAGYSDDSLAPAPMPALRPIQQMGLNISDASPPPHEAMSSTDRDTIANRLARLKEDIANAVWECPSDDADAANEAGAQLPAPRVPARGASAACLKPLRRVMRAREHLLRGTNVRVAKEETALHAPLLPSFDAIRHTRSTREAKRAAAEDRKEEVAKGDSEAVAALVEEEKAADVERVLDGGRAGVPEETKDTADEGFDKRLRRIPSRHHS